MQITRYLYNCGRPCVKKQALSSVSCFSPWLHCDRFDSIWFGRNVAGTGPCVSMPGTLYVTYDPQHTAAGMSFLLVALDGKQKIHFSFTVNEAIPKYKYRNSTGKLKKKTYALIQHKERIWCKPLHQKHPPSLSSGQSSSWHFCWVSGLLSGSQPSVDSCVIWLTHCRWRYCSPPPQLLEHWKDSQ